MRFPQRVPRLVYGVVSLDVSSIGNRLLFLFSLLLLWGESALAGGRYVSGLSLLFFMCGYIVLSVIIAIQYLCAKVYTRYGVKRCVEKSAPAWLGALFMVACVNLPLGLTRIILFEWKYSPLHSYVVDLYAVRPAIDVEKLDEWHLLWHFQRTRSGVSRGYGWSVDVGGFRLNVHDEGPNDFRIDVNPLQ